MDAGQLEKATRLVEAHLPKSLVSAAGPASLIALPKAYCHRIIASVLASEIVYREGIDRFVDVSERQLGELAIDYLELLEKSRRVEALLQADSLGDTEILRDAFNDYLSLRI